MRGQLFSSPQEALETFVRRDEKSFSLLTFFNNFVCCCTSHNLPKDFDLKQNPRSVIILVGVLVSLAALKNTNYVNASTITNTYFWPELDLLNKLKRSIHYMQSMKRNWDLIYRMQNSFNFSFGFLEVYMRNTLFDASFNISFNTCEGNNISPSIFFILL